MRRIGVELPLTIQVPCEGDPGRRLEGGDAARVALLAVLTHLVPAAANIWLENEVDHWRLADRILLRPPGAEPRGEDFERALLRCGNGDLPAYDGSDVLSHLCCPFVELVSWSSTAIANAASAVSHMWSRYSRMAATPAESTR